MRRKPKPKPTLQSLAAAYAAADRWAEGLWKAYRRIKRTNQAGEKGWKAADRAMLRYERADDKAVAAELRLLRFASKNF